MHTISICTREPYKAHVGSGLIRCAGELIAAVTASRRCVLVTDSNVAPLYAGKVCTALEEAGFSVSATVIPAGEQHKTLSVCGDLLSFFAESDLTRSDFVVALGGGVVGDMAGLPPPSTSGASTLFRCPPPCSPPATLRWAEKLP